MLVSTSCIRVLGRSPVSWSLPGPVAKTGVGVRQLIGSSSVLRSLRPEDFADSQFGVPTVKDILLELEKPGRDPRPEFRMASFKDGVEHIGDLQPGMLLEGVVTNVANFGAFVDIGVHQDGLVHVSQLADRFVKDPREVVKAGDIVKVKVVDIDLNRKRIGLTMKLQEPTPATSRTSASASDARGSRSERKPQPEAASKPSTPTTSMGAAFAKLGPRS